MSRDGENAWISTIGNLVFGIAIVHTFLISLIFFSSAEMHIIACCWILFEDSAWKMHASEIGKIHSSISKYYIAFSVGSDYILFNKYHTGCSNGEFILYTRIQYTISCMNLPNSDQTLLSNQIFFRNIFNIVSSKFSISSSCKLNYSILIRATHFKRTHWTRIRPLVQKQADKTDEEREWVRGSIY